jgi:hypothetical protein
VILHRDVLARPPIRHAHADDTRNVTAFQFAIAAAIVTAARAVNSKKIYAASMKAGKKYIDKRKERNEAALHGWDRRNVQKAGRAGYREQRYQMVREPPDSLVFEITATALLKAAKMPANGHNLASIDAALDRLRDRIGESPALLRNWQKRSRLLRLEINGNWLSPPFAEVRLPLPLHKSSAALALYLWLSGLPTKGEHRIIQGIHTTKAERSRQRSRFDFKAFCQRIGVPTERGLRYANKKLDDAMAIVNQHYETHDMRLQVMARNAGDGCIRFDIKKTPQRADIDYDQPVKWRYVPPRLKPIAPPSPEPKPATRTDTGFSANEWWAIDTLRKKNMNLKTLVEMAVGLEAARIKPREG